MEKKRLHNHPVPETGTKEKPELPGFSIHPPREDTYSQWHKVGEVGNADKPEIKVPQEKDLPNSPDFTDAVAGGNELDSTDEQLDVSDSELDDEQENIGSEDEENN